MSCRSRRRGLTTGYGLVVMVRMYETHAPR
jgi:hypothetical protein